MVSKKESHIKSNTDELECVKEKKGYFLYRLFCLLFTVYVLSHCVVY